MKSFIQRAQLLLLFLTTEVVSQEKPAGTEALRSVKLRYEVLDSAAVRETNPLVNIHYRNIVSYYSHYGVRLAYCLADKNKWISVPLPFNERTNDLEVMNLDRKGEAEIVVRGDLLEYGSGGGTGIRGMVILNVDSVPTQIFKLCYQCWDESFGDRTKNGEGASMVSHGREVKIQGGSIVVGPLQKKKPYEGCDLTEIQTGNYLMMNGQIRLNKGSR